MRKRHVDYSLKCGRHFSFDDGLVHQCQAHDVDAGDCWCPCGVTQMTPPPPADESNDAGHA